VHADGKAHAVPGHHIIQIPYFDLFYSSGDEEMVQYPPFSTKIKIEPGTEGPKTGGTDLHW